MNILPHANAISAKEPQSVLDRLLTLKAPECDAFIENSKEIEYAYKRAADKGGTEAPLAEDEVDHHYVCLVPVSTSLHELDGDAEGPRKIGSLANDEDALNAAGLGRIRQYTESQKEGGFGLLALVADEVATGE